MYWDDEYALGEYAELSWDLWRELGECRFQWLETYVEYWGLRTKTRPEHLTEKQWKTAKANDLIATAVYRMAVALTVQGAAPAGRKVEFGNEEWKRMRKALRVYSKGPQIIDRLGLEIADEALGQLEGSTRRAVRLISLIRGRGLSARASEYVTRAAKLYVWGLEPECAVMCRSALEAALATRLEEHYDQDASPPTLNDLIKLAGEQDLLDGFELAPGATKGWRARHGSALWSAQRITWAGNYVAHDMPTFRQECGDLRDAFTTLRELALVLAKLFPVRDGG